ncbi:oxidoreductase [soil metagenome]
MKKVLLLFCCAITSALSAQTNSQLADSVKKGFRGLSVVNENVLWMSGQKGLVGVSTSGGKKWKWNRVKGFEKSDFRSIYAFDKKNCVIANAGFPATILFTTNAGKTWTTSYSSNDSAMFFDGIDFWLSPSGDNKHGLIFGDPVNGRMYLSETFDGGKTWKEIPFENRPQLEEGEAAFAASGTTIRTLPDGHVFIATGGKVSRLWHSRDYGHHWEVFNTPILQGKPSQGIFSIAFYDTLNGIIVGGDYLNDSLEGGNIFMTNDGGHTWGIQKQLVKGYFSSVEYIHDKTVILATGTGQTIKSYNGGGFWWSSAYNTPKSAFGNNTIRMTENKKGVTIFFCGGLDGFHKIYEPVRSKRKIFKRKAIVGIG